MTRATVYILCVASVSVASSSRIIKRQQAVATTDWHWIYTHTCTREYSLAGDRGRPVSRMFKCLFKSLF